MVELDITQEEKDILIEALENSISDLRMEIVDTDSSSFREKLKQRKRVLNKVLHMIEGKKAESDEDV